MDYNDKLIEDTVLALLALYSFNGGQAWKRFDFEIMNRLHEQGMISQPRGRAESVRLSPEGLERGQQIAGRLFGIATPRSSS